MAHYVDGYVIPLPKKNVTAYRRGAQAGPRRLPRYGGTTAHSNSASALATIRTSKWDYHSRAELRLSPTKL